jgi:signal transduction histidine kinase
MWILAALSGFILGALLMYGVLHRQSKASDKKAWLAQIQQAIQTLPFAIFYFARDGRLLLCNRQARKQLGLLDSNWSKVHFADLEENQIQQTIQDTIIQLSVEKKSKSDLQCIITNEQGRKFKLTAFSFLEPPFIVQGYLVYLVDVSLELKSQQAIEWAVWAQRLAHDIKNPLSIIKLTMQQLEILIDDQQIDRSRFLSQLYSVMEEVERLRLTADGFMKLLNAQNISRELYQTEAIVPVIIERITRFLPENISLKSSLEKELPDIEIDLDQFLIVTDNIVANATLAMPKGGTLTLDIKTYQRFHIDSKRLEQHLIIFEFSDTGVGMSSEQLDKIFEPFYTTTPDGTGLGLAICKKIIAEHNGQLVVQSRKGIGTIVRIEIPITKQKGGE